MKIDPHQITIVDPASLRVHPLAADLPELADDDPDFLAMLDDIREHGQLHPVDIDSHQQILDGKHRWRICKRLKMPAMTAIVRQDEEAVSIILESLLLRRHYTKSALAYTAYPMLRAAYEEARANRKGHSVAHPFTVETQAERFGISKSLYKYAGQVYEIFCKDQDYKDFILPRLLAGDVGLGAVVAGFAGREATKGKPKPKGDQLKLFKRAWVDLRNRYAYWDGFNDDQRSQAYTAITDAFDAMPEQLLIAVERRLKARIKQITEGR